MTGAPGLLEQALGYAFAEPQLLRQALTHRSAGSRNNERLEFLGDAILGCVIAEELYERYPQAREGELSRLRATLVRRESLAAVAHALEVGSYLHLGSGERKSGGHRRDSILADALEALFGAIYLDSGFRATRTSILALFADKLESLSGAAGLKDPKTRLQEYLQAQRKPLPEYTVTEVSGEAHAQSFRVACSIQDVDVTPSHGEGSSRRQAEQDAAARMLALLEHD